MHISDARHFAVHSGNCIKLARQVATFELVFRWVLEYTFLRHNCTQKVSSSTQYKTGKR